MKDYENMSDHELLMELVEEKRKNDIRRYIRYGIDAVIVIVIAVIAYIYVPKIVEMVNRYNSLMNQVKEIGNEVEGFTSSFDPQTLEDLKELIEKLQKLFSSFGFMGG